MGEIVVNPGAIDALNDKIANVVKRKVVSGTIQTSKHYETYYVDISLDGVSRDKVLAISVDNATYNAPVFIQLLTTTDTVRAYSVTNNITVNIGVLYKE